MSEHTNCGIHSSRPESRKATVARVWNSLSYMTSDRIMFYGRMCDHILQEVWSILMAIRAATLPRVPGGYTTQAVQKGWSVQTVMVRYFPLLVYLFGYEDVLKLPKSAS